MPGVGRRGRDLWGKWEHLLDAPAVGRFGGGLWETWGSGVYEKLGVSRRKWECPEFCVNGPSSQRHPSWEDQRPGVNVQIRRRQNEVAVRTGSI